MKALIREFIKSNGGIKRISKTVKYTDVFNDNKLVFPEEFIPRGISQLEYSEKIVEYKNGTVDSKIEHANYTVNDTDNKISIESKFNSSGITKTYIFDKDNITNKYLLKTFINDSDCIYTFDKININGNILPYNTECKTKDYTLKKFYNVINNHAKIIQRETINNHTKATKIAKYNYDDYGNMTKKYGNVKHPLSIKYRYYNDGSIWTKGESYINHYNLYEFNKDGYILKYENCDNHNCSWKYDKYNRVIVKKENRYEKKSEIVSNKYHEFNDDNTVETIRVEITKINNVRIKNNKPMMPYCHEDMLYNNNKTYRSTIIKTYDSPYLNDGKSNVTSICGIYNKEYNMLVDEKYNYIISNNNTKISKLTILNHDTKKVLFTKSYEYNNDGLISNIIEESINNYLYKESYKYFDGTDIISSITYTIE